MGQWLGHPGPDGGRERGASGGGAWREKAPRGVGAGGRAGGRRRHSGGRLAMIPDGARFRAQAGGVEDSVVQVGQVVDPSESLRPGAAGKHGQVWAPSRVLAVCAGPGRGVGGGVQEDVY